VATALTFPSVARAQGRNDDLARADSLFNAGKALLDAGQNVDACAKFAESKRLAPGLGVTLYLADCYERIGRTASAWSEFRSAEGLARERNDKRAEVARGRAQALEPKLDRLTITVAPSVPQAGLQVLRDGAAVSSDEWGLAVPVDPGDHVVIVTAPGHPQQTFPAHVGPEAPSATVRIDRLEDNAAAPTPTPVPVSAPVPESTAPVPEPTPSASDPGATRRWIGVGLAGVGVVGVALGAVFGLGAKSKLDQSNQDNHCDAKDTCDTTGLSLRQDASNAATLSTVMFAIGGVAVAGGAVLYFTAPHRPTTTGLVVTPAPGGGAAMLRGTF
jgi:serine/threonine-protein kinase